MAIRKHPVAHVKLFVYYSLVHHFMSQSFKSQELLHYFGGCKMSRSEDVYRLEEIVLEIKQLVEEANHIFRRYPGEVERFSSPPVLPDSFPPFLSCPMRLPEN